MAIRTYEFDYQCGDASATIVIDTEIFTKETALIILEFFTWDWDPDGDLITEVAKKYALEVIQVASEQRVNVRGVREEFDSKEGFAPFGQKYGIQLKEVEHYEFTDYALEFEMKED
ncbi:hypothetical protein [Sphingobacterium kitahiroshimense]|uniref:hypothetical protein n=1 Tax=Sphingobacterium kitahiroshimense TaxID=470446 RepID=UPI00320A20A6